jgi:hypothetical protein
MFNSKVNETMSRVLCLRLHRFLSGRNDRLTNVALISKPLVNFYDYRLENHDQQSFTTGRYKRRHACHQEDQLRPQWSGRQDVRNPPQFEELMSHVLGSDLVVVLSLLLHTSTVSFRVTDVQQPARSVLSSSLVDQTWKSLPFERWSSGS